MLRSDRAAGATRPRRRLALLALLSLAAAARPANALPIRVRYVDRAATGFDDQTLGLARRAALEQAVAILAATLAGDVPIVVQAAMVPLGGSGDDAVLARTSTISLHRSFPGSKPATWYGAALASELAGTDLNGEDVDEIAMTFNSDVDGPIVLGAVDWYYGADAQAGPAIDFVTIALHEIGHGLNFFDVVDPTSGAPLIENHFGIFEAQLERQGLGFFPGLRQGERLAAITSGRLVWSGPNVLAAARAPVAMYTPPVFAPGSSLSHWDAALTPDEIIEPFYTGPNHDLGLLLPALTDMGWELAVPSPTPRSTAPLPAATATATASPTRTATPDRSPSPRHYAAFVSNFDDATVSVIDDATGAVIATLRVGAGPLGVAVNADGSRVYVACFHSGSLSVLTTSPPRVMATIPVSESAHSVALSPDERLAYVTDTFTGEIAVVDLATRAVLQRIPVGPQPAGLAVEPDTGRVFVTSFGGSGLWVVDGPLGEVVALIPALQYGLTPIAPLSVALAPRRRLGYVASEADFGGIFALDLRNLRAVVGLEFLDGLRIGSPEAVAFAPDEQAVYATARYGGGGRLHIIDPDTKQLIGSIVVGDVPEAVALVPGGSSAYVANTGDSTVSIVDTAARAVRTTVAVGAAPMGIAVAELPPSPCTGDCRAVGAVSIGDLITAVDIALGNQLLSACERADADGDRAVTIGELIAATANALRGCPD